MSFSVHLAFTLLFLLHISAVLSDTSVTSDGFYVGSEEVTAYEAAKLCKEKSMQLVSIQNDEKNKKIEKLFQQHKINMAIWTSGRKSWGNFFWLKEAGSYTRWAPNQPDASGKIVDCIEIYLTSNGLAWNDHPCGSKRRYICEKRSSPDSPKSPQMKEFHLSKEKATREEAELKCDDMSMQLAIIHNEEENQNLYKLIKEKGDKLPYWTSGYREPHAQIGGTGLGLVIFKATWLWLNEEPMKYFNWAANEPNGNPGWETCIEVAVKDNDLLWNDNACSGRRKYVCEKTKEE